MPQNPIAVILVDDHAIMRQGLRLLIEGHQDIEIVGEAKTGREAIKIATHHKPDVVIMEKLNIHDIAGLTRFAIATGRIENRGQKAIQTDADSS